MLSYSVKNFTHYQFSEKILRKIFSVCEKQIPALRGKEISLVFVGDMRMRKLNREYRGKDTTTDVLSFSYGEIFLNPREARRYNANFIRELSLLIVHGLLHIVGYDHNTKQKEKIMFGLQEDLLKKIFR